LAAGNVDEIREEAVVSGERDVTTGADAEAGRSLAMDVTIDAPVDAVWKALSDGEEISRWFAPEARVEGGAGGTIWLSWGAGVEGEAAIHLWEPGRRLGYTESMPDLKDPSRVIPLTVEFEIEARGGSTVVRLVHSGFGAGAEWDAMYDGMESGWGYFLLNLAFYLVRHRGSLRRMISSRRKTTKPVKEIWDRLLGSGGMNVDGAKAGERYALRLRDVESGGRVKIRRADLRSFAGTLESMNDGLIFVEMEGGSPAWHCGVWISLYDVPDARADLVQDALTALMDDVFAA
jgi:uncharacterized protein YndB with AHSA1/START domain